MLLTTPDVATTAEARSTLEVILLKLLLVQETLQLRSISVFSIVLQTWAEVNVADICILFVSVPLTEALPTADELNGTVTDVI